MGAPKTMFTGILCRGCGGECERGDRAAICGGCRPGFDLGYAAAMKKRLPRLTDKVLRGIIGSTSNHLAGIGDGGEVDDIEDEIQAADDWAKTVRDARKSP